MVNYRSPLLAALALAFAVSAHSAEKPRPAQGTASQPKKIWTNDDMPGLRAQGLISIVGQEPSAEAPQAPAAPEEFVFPVYESRLDDPDWYAAQAADLQAELDDAVAALQQETQALTLARDERVTQPGVALDRPSVGVTPGAALELFQARVDEIQMQLDELSNLARQHDIEPGALRGQA